MPSGRGEEVGSASENVYLLVCPSSWAWDWAVAPEMEDSGIPAPHSTLTSIYVGYSQPVDLLPGKQKAFGICSGPAGGGSSHRQTAGSRPAGDDSKRAWGGVLKPPSLTQNPWWGRREVQTAVA